MAQLEANGTAPQPLDEVPLLSDPVSLDEKAAEMVKKAMDEEGLQNHGLRVGVIGGGCSGLQYLLDFAQTPHENDFVSEFFDVPVYTDPYSAAHLRGTLITYQDTLHGSGFKFENPNIVRSCGCGSSFQT